MKAFPQIARYSVLALAISMLLFVSAAFAKRAPVQIAEPVRYKHFEFRASDQPETMGVVTVWDSVTKKKVCDITAYKVRTLPFLEKDVQWVFIKSMSFDWPILKVTNEKGKIYKINVEKYLPASATKEVTIGHELGHTIS